MENLPSKETTEGGKPQLPEKQNRTVSDEMTALIPLAGTIELSEADKIILYAPVKEEDIEIRPDGLIYLPWMEYVERLKAVFGMSWAIIPQSMPAIKDNFVMWPGWLIIRGRPAGFAVGEQEYHPNNRTMSYSDAIEGAKSNCLMRLCKGLGISLELWKPSFIRAWKAKNAEEFNDQGRKKWRKKGSINGQAKQETTKAFDWLERMKKAKTLLGEERYYEILTGRYTHTHANEVTEPKEQEEILQELTLAYKGGKKGGE